MLTSREVRAVARSFPLSRRERGPGGEDHNLARSERATGAEDGRGRGGSQAFVTRKVDTGDVNADTRCQNRELRGEDPKGVERTLQSDCTAPWCVRIVRDPSGRSRSSGSGGCSSATSEWALPLPPQAEQ